MKHIDKLFQEKLYNHEAHVPEGMWEKIAPIAEEETGRAILWFWFAGIIALSLGAYGLYQMMQKESQPVDPSTLVYEASDKSTNTAVLVENQLTSKNLPVIANEDSSPSHTLESEIKEESNSISVINQKEVKNQLPPTVRKSQKNIKVTTTDRSPQTVSNTVENISSTEGVPVNLVITKSYINKEGSIIKQSSLNNKTYDEPVYDVIINSEAKNVSAGALLRIVEPLEQISLPALSRELKKKSQVAIF